LNNRDELTKMLLESGGWESLNGPVVEEGNYDKAIELASQFRIAFDSGSGKYVLEHMVSTYLTKPIVRAGEDAYAQGIREGRADIIRQILAQIEFAKKGEK